MPITNNPPPVKGTISTSARPARKIAATTAKRTEAISQLGMFAQVPLIATRQFADVGAINLHWPKISEEIAKLADQDEQVAKIIDPLLQVGPYAGLIAAVLPLVMQVAVNHGRMSPGAMGTQPKSALSAQVESALAQQELEALQIQLQAERDSAKMRKEIEDSRKAMADAMHDQQRETTDD